MKCGRLQGLSKLLTPWSYDAFPPVLFSSGSYSSSLFWYAYDAAILCVRKFALADCNLFSFVVHINVSYQDPSKGFCLFCGRSFFVTAALRAHPFKYSVLHQELIRKRYFFYYVVLSKTLWTNIFKTNNNHFSFARCSDSGLLAALISTKFTKTITDSAPIFFFFSKVPLYFKAAQFNVCAHTCFLLL